MENNQLRCTSVQNMKMVQHCCRFAQNLKHENNEFVLFIFINKKISERSVCLIIIFFSFSSKYYLSMPCCNLTEFLVLSITTVSCFENIIT